MDDVFRFLLLGLGIGALHAALAQGIVLAYRGSGVINLSHGAVAGYTAYTYAALRRDGELLIPPLPNPLSLVEGVVSWFGAELALPDIPTFVSFGGRLTFPAALAVSLVVAAALGFVLHVAVFRPLRTAPVLAKVVAAVGVTVVLQAILQLRFGQTPVNVAPILPNETVEVFGATVQRDRLYLAGIVLVAAAVLAAVYRRTRFGLATRAAAENERGVTLLGYDPARQAAANWVLAALLAGIVGILASPITTLTPLNYTLFVIPALGAALLGGFTSFGVAAIAGLLLGMVDQLLVLLLTKPGWSWLPDAGAREAFPLVVILVTLALRGRSLPVRGAVVDGRLPFAPRPRHVGRVAVALTGIGAVAMVTLPFDWRQALMVSLVGVVISLSLVVLTGFVGQISLAQLTIAGVAAFALTRVAGSWGVPFPVAPLLAALVATATGVLVGLPALRVRGVNLAVVTLSLAYALDALVFRNDDLVSRTAPRASAPSLFGIGLGPLDDFPVGDDKVPSPGFGLLLLVVVGALCVAVANLRLSATGRRMLAVRSNERAAATAGVDVLRTKLLGFAIASFIAGIGGALISYQFDGGVDPAQFAALLSLSALATAYLGGISTVSGAVVAGSLAVGGWSFFVVDRVFDSGEWTVLASGLGLIVTAVLNPEGIAGAVRHGVAAARHRHSPRRESPTSAPRPVLEEAAA